MRVLVHGGQPMLVSALVRALDDLGHLTSVETDTCSAIAEVSTGEIDVCIVGLPVGPDSPELLATVTRLRTASSVTPVVVLTDDRRGPCASASRSAGATAVTDTTSSLTDLVGVLHDAHAGRPQRITAPSRVPRPRALSPRERQVLGLVATGSSVTGIAELLGVSPSTVRSHIAAARTKLSARNRVEAVVSNWDATASG